MPNLPPKRRVLEDARVLKVLRTAKAEQQTFRERYDELEELLFPNVRESRLHALLAASTDADEMAKIRKALAELRDPGTGAAKGRAEILVKEAARPLQAATEELISAALEVAGEVLAEAEAAEADFFATHDLPTEKTSVSRRVDKVIAELKQFQPQPSTSLTMPRPPMRGHKDELLRWFTV